MSLRPLHMVGALLSLASCRSPTESNDEEPHVEDDCSAEIEPSVMPLLGSRPHPPLEDGVVLSVVRGLQGGFHTYLSVEARGMAVGADNLMDGLSDQTLPVTHWEILAPDGVVTVEQEHWTVAEGSAEAWVTGPHLVVMQYFEVPPAAGFERVEREAALETMEMELTLRVVDHCGREASASRTVWLAFDDEEPDTPADTGAGAAH